MEAIVPGCVGVLTAVSAAILLDVRGDRLVKEARARFAAHMREAVRKAEALRCEAECIAARSGFVSMRLRSRRAHVEEQLPETFGALAISLGSGLSLPQAVRYVGRRADEPMSSEFLRAASEMGCGVSVPIALDGLVERLQAPGLELVALALKVSRRTGSPLAELLAEAARLAGERVELSRRLDVKTSQARMSARLITCMPVAMMAFLLVFSGDFRAGVATVPGACSIAVALTLNVTAWVIIRRIMRVRF